MKMIIEGTIQPGYSSNVWRNRLENVFNTRFKVIQEKDYIKFIEIDN